MQKVMVAAVACLCPLGTDTLVLADDPTDSQMGVMKDRMKAKHDEMKGQGEAIKAQGQDMKAAGQQMGSEMKATGQEMKDAVGAMGKEDPFELLRGRAKLVETSTGRLLQEPRLVPPPAVC